MITLDNFSGEEIEVINSIKNVCKKFNIEMYLVGGAVRDALLREKIKDIDICINENPKIIIENLLNIKSYEYHDKFQTSTILFNNGTSIDLIRCRREVYEQNGKLPVVTPSNIYDDLYRRDFTVNALAYDLINETILDMYNGLEHLEEKKFIKIHCNSYNEDPTRILRVIKYSTRYSFEISDKEEIVKTIEEGIFQTVSNDRIIKEIYMLCKEKNWEENIRKCYSMGIFKLKIKELGLQNHLINYSCLECRILNLFYIMEDLKYIEMFLNNSFLHKDLNKAIKYYYINKNKIVDLLTNTMDNYEIYKILKDIEWYSVLLLCWNKELSYKILNYAYNLKDLELNINGNYLNQLGIKKGKNIGKVLQYILKLKLNIGISDDEKYLLLNLGEIKKCL